MPISQTRYIAINSSVGGNGGVALRSLNMRLISTNPLVPTGTVLTFSGGNGAAFNDIEQYFGPNAAETLRAEPYFAWISKQGNSPQAIDYYFWNQDAPTGSLIYGVQGTYALSTFTPINSGSLNLTLGGFTNTLTGINLTSAANLAAVATDLQNAIRGYSAGGVAWTAATVAYDSTNNRFTLTSGTTGTDIVSIAAAATGTDLAPLIGWAAGAILSNGTNAQTITQMLAQMAQISNNFGTFVFVPTLSNSNVEAAAAWNATQNNMYRYSAPCTSSNAATLFAALAEVAGCDLTLAPISTEYPEQTPGTIEAATDYTERNAVQNYMYQTNFTWTPSVTNDADANTYDALNVNYYGNTQNAGQIISFYQRGFMMGGTNVPTDMGTYANEQWLKSAIFTALMNLLLSQGEVSANKTGKAQTLASIQGVINRATFNAVISVGKTLTEEQQLFITQVTGDPQAWLQVQNQGYWVNCVIQSYVNSENNQTEYKAVYTLIYAKNDAIRVIDGNDILI